MDGQNSSRQRNQRPRPERKPPRNTGRKIHFLRERRPEQALGNLLGFSGDNRPFKEGTSQRGVTGQGGKDRNDRTHRIRDQRPDSWEPARPEITQSLRSLKSKSPAATTRMDSGAIVSISKAALFLLNLLTGKELVTSVIVVVQRLGRNDP